MSSETSLKFLNEIMRTIEYFRVEFELTYIEAIGSLDVVKHKLLSEVDEEDSEEEDGS